MPLVGGDDDYSGFYNFLIEDGQMSESHLNISVPVSDEVLAELQAIIDRNELVLDNGIDRHTDGLPAEFQPCYFNAVYKSGERLCFSYDNNPFALWAREIFDLFRNTFIENGHDELLPSREARTIKNFCLSFQFSDDFFEYTFIKDGDDIKLYQVVSCSNEKEAYVRVDEEVLENLQLIVEKYKLKKFHDDEHRERLQGDDLFDIYIDYENHHQITGVSYDEETLNEFKSLVGDLNRDLQALFTN